MYISTTVVVLILAIGLVGTYAGAYIGGISHGSDGVERGGFAGLAIGAVAAIGVILMCQNSEVESWQYERAARLISADCRMTPLGRRVLGDRVITQAEFWRLEDMSDDIRLANARSRINGDSLRQCATRS